GEVEFILEPTGVGAVVLAQDAGERPPLGGLIAAGRGLVGTSCVLGWVLVGGKSTYRSDDDAHQWHHHDEKLRQPEQQAHMTRIPSRLGHRSRSHCPKSAARTSSPSTLMPPRSGPGLPGVSTTAW